MLHLVLNHFDFPLRCLLTRFQLRFPQLGLAHFLVGGLLQHFGALDLLRLLLDYLF